MTDSPIMLTIEAFKKKVGFFYPDRVYFKLLEYRYGIQPATYNEWLNRIAILKSGG